VPIESTSVSRRCICRELKELAKAGARVVDAEVPDRASVVHFRQLGADLGVVGPLRANEATSGLPASATMLKNRRIADREL
jgi:hypothetical protein